MSWHIRISITLDRNEIWAWDLYHFTALVKSVAYILDVKKHGKVPYQKPKVYGTVMALYPHNYYSAIP